MSGVVLARESVGVNVGGLKRSHGASRVAAGARRLYYRSFNCLPFDRGHGTAICICRAVHFAVTAQLECIWR